MITISIKLINFTLIYFTAHMLFFSYFKKKMDLLILFKSSILLIDSLSLIAVYITIVLSVLMPESRKTIGKAWIDKKDAMLFIILLLQTIYHLLIQIMFQKNKTIKSLSVIINSSIAASSLTLCFIVLTKIVAKKMFDIF